MKINYKINKQKHKITFCPDNQGLEIKKKKNSYMLLSKDLKISQALADMLNTKSPLGKKVKNLYEEFCRDYQQDLDYSAIIKYIDTKI